MEESILTKVFLPFALAFIMAGMGLSLQINDFKKIISFPKAFFVGVVCQMILLPIVGYLLISIFHIQGALAVGVMIIAACPGGATSNLISHLAKGDTALSISLTAITSLVTVITIPLIVNYSITHFGEEGSVTLPLGRTIAQIFAITVIPVALGMYIKKKKPKISEKADQPVKFFSAFFLALVIAAAIIKERENLVELMQLTGPIMLTLNVGMMLIGFAIGKIFMLPAKQSITVAIESGIQNGTLGIFIAATLLQNSNAAIPSAIYSLLMFLTGFMVIMLGYRFIKTSPSV
ncbi:MAG: bile acid:sodium symporter family protein [Flavobacteriales bacterium]